MLISGSYTPQMELQEFTDIVNSKLENITPIITEGNESGYFIRNYGMYKGGFFERLVYSIKSPIQKRWISLYHDRYGKYHLVSAKDLDSILDIIADNLESMYAREF